MSLFFVNSCNMCEVFVTSLFVLNLYPLYLLQFMVNKVFFSEKKAISTTEKPIKEPACITNSAKTRRYVIHIYRSWGMVTVSASLTEGHL